MNTTNHDMRPIGLTDNALTQRIQCSSIQSVGLLKALYISLPDRPVNSDTNSTALGSTQPRCNYCCNIVILCLLNRPDMCLSGQIVSELPHDKGNRSPCPLRPDREVVSANRNKLSSFSNVDRDNVSRTVLESFASMSRRNGLSTILTCIMVTVGSIFGGRGM